MPLSADRQVPSWPLFEVLLAPDGTAVVDGAPVPVPADGNARAAGLARAAETAHRIGRPVRVRLTDTDSTQWLLALHPDGTDTVLRASEPKLKPRAKSKSRKGERERPETSASAVIEAEARPKATGPAPDSMESRLVQALAAQDWPLALEMCADLVRETPPSEAGEVREIQARVTALHGDHETAYTHFRILADLRLANHGPTHPSTVAAADEAQTQWARLGPEDALRLGPDLLALRERVPGSDRRRLTEARRHLLRLRVG